MRAPPGRGRRLGGDPKATLMSAPLLPHRPAVPQDPDHPDTLRELRGVWWRLVSRFNRFRRNLPAERDVIVIDGGKP